MTFSLKMSQDIFQMKMDQLTNKLHNIIAIHDDMYMWLYSPGAQPKPIGIGEYSRMQWSCL